MACLGKALVKMKWKIGPLIWFVGLFGGDGVGRGGGRYPWVRLWGWLWSCSLEYLWVCVVVSISFWRDVGRDVVYMSVGDVFSGCFVPLILLCICDDSWSRYLFGKTVQLVIFW